MRRSPSPPPTTVADLGAELTEIRRVVGLLGEPTRRERLLAAMGELEAAGRRDTVEEVRATTEAARLRHDLAAARQQVDDAERQVAELRVELGRVRRELGASRSRLRELRELADAGLADRLLEVAVRVEAQLPTAPPLISVRRAAALSRAVEATAAATP